MGNWRTASIAAWILTYCKVIGLPLVNGSY